MLINVVSSFLAMDGPPGTLLYRHPLYNEKWWWRELGRVSYIGGRDYSRPSLLSVDFQQPMFGEKVVNDITLQNQFTGIETENIRSLLFRHDREKPWEFHNRRQRAYYNNFVRVTANSLVSHATNVAPTRKGSTQIEEFWNGVDPKRTMTMDKYVKAGMQQAEVQGLMWAVMDVKPVAKGGDGKPYLYWVSPIDIIDWEADEDGEIVWLKQFCFATTKRRWDEKVTPRFRFRIWDRKGIVTWETNTQGGEQTQISSVPNTLGVVPFVPLFSVRESDSLFPDGYARLGDMCKGANHIYNLGSLLSEINYKQTFSWLMIPDKDVDVLQMGVNTAFGWDGANSGGAKPEYLSPDAEQPRVLVESMVQGISDLRQSVGVGRGRQEGSMQKPSADALELETEDKRSILGDMSDEAADFERRVARMFNRYRTGQPDKTADDATVVMYASDFNVGSLEDEINEAMLLKNFQLSPEVNLEMVTQLVRRKFGNMEPEALTTLVGTLKKAQADALAKAAAISAAPKVPGAETIPGGDGAPITPVAPNPVPVAGAAEPA